MGSGIATQVLSWSLGGLLAPGSPSRMSPRVPVSPGDGRGWFREGASRWFESERTHICISITEEEIDEIGPPTQDYFPSWFLSHFEKGTGPTQARRAWTPGLGATVSKENEAKNF